MKKEIGRWINRIAAGAAGCFLRIIRPGSEIWRRDALLDKGRVYLVEAASGSSRRFVAICTATGNSLFGNDSFR